jgi:trans-2,3-dihydro-3-hydroxyanthranilate isomerase
MRYKFFTCDVFTASQFGGNQLAVLPDATGLSTETMQRIAREFNYSESTFVFPAEQGYTRKVRIFTPSAEVPFAGHPNVGTAFVLAKTGQLGKLHNQLTVTFEENAGLVPVTIQQRPDQGIWCELRAPEQLSIGKVIAVEEAAATLSLSTDDICTQTHPPQVASVGLPFLLVELKSREALQRARVSMDHLDKLAARGVVPDIHLYYQSKDEFDIRARMFAPLDGILEDPATGSANCALAGLLTHHHELKSGEFSWRIAQGVEMGRPSSLEARTEKKDGRVAHTWIGGLSVLVTEGHIEVA